MLNRILLKRVIFIQFSFSLRLQERGLHQSSYLCVSFLCNFVQKWKVVLFEMQSEFWILYPSKFSELGNQYYHL